MTVVADAGRDRWSQFGLPRGVAGRLAGWVMALGNADMERQAVDALHLDSTGSVLEIGFGPGVGIGLLARRLQHGRIAGIDPSEVMLAQARRRNRRLIVEGRVDLQLGTAANLPWPDRSFDAVVSVNNIHQWPSLRHDLAEVHRVLRPTGQLSLGLHIWIEQQAKDRGRPDQPWEWHLEACLSEAGFTHVDVRHSTAVSARALYILAQSGT